MYTTVKNNQKAIGRRRGSPISPFSTNNSFFFPFPFPFLFPFLISVHFSFPSFFSLVVVFIKHHRHINENKVFFLEIGSTMATRSKAGLSGYLGSSLMTLCWSDRKDSSCRTLVLVRDVKRPPTSLIIRYFFNLVYTAEQ